MLRTLCFKTRALCLKIPEQITWLLILMLDVEITESAQEYLAGLLEKQETEGVGIRMFVANPGTPKAETCIAYCKPGEQQEDDVRMALDGFDAFFDSDSVPFLSEAKVDYSPDKMGGQLTIKAPNSKMPRITEDSSTEEKINYVLYNEVNPGLAAHGGNVSLLAFTDEGIAVLRFGGGCQGCSAVDMTLKQGVEKTLMEQIPEIKGVRDETDHSDKSQAYY